MKKLIILLLMVFVLVIFNGCVRVDPDEGGVRTNYIIFKGVSKKTLGPGLYLSIPNVTEVDTYIVREQIYEMTKEGESVAYYQTQGKGKGKFKKTIKKEGKRDDVMLRTKDGQLMWIDVTVRFQLLRDKLPVLHQEFGKNYISDAIRPLARALVNYKFGQLSAEEIYDGKNRERVGLEIKKLMNQGYESETGLKDKGIFILDVLFRRYEFTEEYTKAIEQKRLAVEQKLAAMELAKKKEAEAEGEKLAIIQRAEAEAIRRKKEADAEYYYQQQRAKGIELVGMAEAKTKKALVEALGGGQYLVQLEFAKKLSDKLQVWGVPTGSQNASFLDLSGIFGNMYPKPKSRPRMQQPNTSNTYNIPNSYQAQNQVQTQTQTK